jgi:hypothetical protein
MDSDKRKLSRAEFHTTARFITKDVEYELEVVNISLKGLYARKTGENPLPEKGMNGHVSVRLASSPVTIEVNAKVIHIEEDHVGLKFEGMDVDSLAHLRRLMEMNTGKSNIFVRELSFLLED